MSDKEASPEYIRFMWQHARKKGKYGLDSLDHRQKKILEKKLREYEKHTLDSFRRIKGVHLQEFDLKTCRKAPSEHQQMQVKQAIFIDIHVSVPVLRFRVSNKMRVLGYRRKNKFYVIWVDANHEMGG